MTLREVVIKELEEAKINLQTNSVMTKNMIIKKRDGTILNKIKSTDHILKVKTSHNITEIKEKIKIAKDMTSYLRMEHYDIYQMWFIDETGKKRMCCDRSPEANPIPSNLVRIEGTDLWEMPEQREARIDDTGSARLS